MLCQRLRFIATQCERLWPSTRFILLYTSLLAGVGEYRTSLYIARTRCLFDRYVSSPLFSLGYWSVLDKYTYINILTVYMFFRFSFYFNFYPLKLKVTLMNVREINSKKIPSVMYLEKIVNYQDLTCFVIFSSTVGPKPMKFYDFFILSFLLDVLVFYLLFHSQILLFKR